MLARPKLNKNEALTVVKDLTSSFVKFSFNNFLFPVISSKIKTRKANQDKSDSTEKHAFETLTAKKSKWTPPQGQFASID